MTNHKADDQVTKDAGGTVLEHSAANPATNVWLQLSGDEETAVARFTELERFCGLDLVLIQTHPKAYDGGHADTVQLHERTRACVYRYSSDETVSSHWDIDDAIRECMSFNLADEGDDWAIVRVQQMPVGLDG